MKHMRLLCWNVNGIRAADKKGLFTWLTKEQPEILCLQEIKANPEQIPPHLRNTPQYHVFINSAERKGYSGVATYTQQKPVTVKNGFGISKFDTEGRVLITEFPDFVFFNIYFPNGKKNKERLEYKLDFYNTFLAYADNLKAKGKNIIVCGDFNTAHTEIDLARPKENEKISGFLPIERAWIDTFIDHGYIDTFRYFHPEPGQYSWWDMKTRARERNIGWRIDYFFVNKEFISKVSDAFILQDVLGSDHCPIGIEIDV
ncbi:MAG: exodeoxyribonuclease III [Candidatus Thermoplasmatota archaeon]|nr:exodeoxyribonuclease III [Candidatus Thermoplasmatota archaeon]MBU1941725.1 exodeoxyribonuclease III [Candidatus Thermoplasmatota archaeon]